MGKIETTQTWNHILKYDSDAADWWRIYSIFNSMCSILNAQILFYSCWFALKKEKKNKINWNFWTQSSKWSFFMIIIWLMYCIAGPLVVTSNPGKSNAKSCLHNLCAYFLLLDFDCYISSRRFYVDQKNNIDNNN